MGLSVHSGWFSDLLGKCRGYAFARHRRDLFGQASRQPPAMDLPFVGKLHGDIFSLGVGLATAMVVISSARLGDLDHTGRGFAQFESTGEFIAYNFIRFGGG